MPDSNWQQQAISTLDGYYRMIVASTSQLSDDQLFQKPKPGFNSVANLLRHLGGNLRSRWTDFLTTDGEKPDRNRDSEFEDWDGDRESLIAFFNDGWSRFRQTLESLGERDLQATILIRGENHSVSQAILRSLTHVAYHVGQINLVARMIHDDDKTWNWMTIQPGQSKTFNESTWGTSKSRGIAGQEKASSQLK